MNFSYEESVWYPTRNSTIAVIVTVIAALDFDAWLLCIVILSTCGYMWIYSLMFVMSQRDVRRARLSAIRLPLGSGRCPGFRLPVLTRTSHLSGPWLRVGFLLLFLGLRLALDGVHYARLPVRSSTFLWMQCCIARSSRRSRLLRLRTVKV